MTKSSNVSALPVVTSLRMTRKEHETLKALAARENRSVSGQLRHIIEGLAKSSTVDLMPAEPDSGKAAA